ncbi:MAG: ATP synthase subunit I [Thioalkalispiraceae bacterium]|jgi:ATP synthase protein I
MLRATDSLRVALRKTLIIQAVLTAIAAIIALLVKSPSFALHLVYGGAVTSIGTGLHAWRLLKITMPTDAKDDKIGDPIAAQANALGNAGAEAFKGVILKLGAMIALLAFGMGYLKLDPLAVVIGFSVSYLGFVFAGGYAPRSPGR